MFTALVDSISPENVSILSKERRFNLLKKCMRGKTDVGQENVAGTLKKLLRIVEEEYVRQMKKCIVLKEMNAGSSSGRFNNLKVPIVLCQNEGVVSIPKYDYAGNYQNFSMKHWNKDQNQVTVTEKLVIRSLRILEQRFMNTNKSVLKLPKELKDLMSIQNSHYAAVQQNISIQWRDYFVAEIQDDLKEAHDFYEPNIGVYKDSDLKRIVARFELLLHTYLREFVKNSIDDWVEFIRSFTKPDYSKGQLWTLSTNQMLVVHLSTYTAKKDGKSKKRETSPSKAEIPDKSIILEPSLET